MRLINTKTRLIEEFLSQDIPEYAILSHAWGTEEVTYQEYSTRAGKAKLGYRKIQKTCEVAAAANIPYAWVDTCCIDKKSSAELSEAINSMFQWYKESKICYAFLSDLSHNGSLEKDLGQCRWFRRGWTLQELIAPKIVLFFDARWRERGSKTALAELLSAITKIDIGVLRNETPLSRFSIAQKLSWAALRVATRTEDNAYCLLGLLNIHMPLLYGEREKAFQRLQQELVRSTSDLSIFAWQYEPEQGQEYAEKRDAANSPGPDISPKDGFLCGVLAKSPAAFSKCSTYAKSPRASLREFSITNVGVKIRVQLLFRRLENGAKGYFLPLDCRSQDRALGLYLRQVGSNEFLREDPFSLYSYEEGSVTVAPSAERLLLTALPEDQFDLTTLLGRKREILKSRRTAVLQIEPQKSMELESAWPVYSYDFEDQLFVNFRDPARDFGIIDVYMPIQFSKLGTTPKNPSYARFGFCAYGWSSKDKSAAQFGIFPWNEHATALNQIKTELRDSGGHSHLLGHHLNCHKVPKSLAVQFPWTSGYTAHVTLHTIRKWDPAISQAYFWSVSFEYYIANPGQAPDIGQGSQWASSSNNQNIIA